MIRSDNLVIKYRKKNSFGTTRVGIFAQQNELINNAFETFRK